MKKVALPLLALCCILSKPCDAQGLLKKIKDKASQVANKTVGADSTKTTQTSSGSTSEEVSTGSTGKPTNKGGAGLKNTAPPDVNQQITEADQSYKAKNYSDARYSIQQALMGVELQLGRELLKSLPAEVNRLPKDTMQDKVASTQWGWSNMTIQRVYFDQKEKQVTVTIGNNSFYYGMVNMYFNNMGLIEANSKDQNMKMVKVKGYKAMIQYDDSKGYTLIVPIGQTSTIVWECINFADENEVMTTAQAFDIDGIKRMLGEQ